MFLDLGFEYNACFDEFKYNRVMEISNDDMWISCHTERGKQYLLDNYKLDTQLNVRIKLNHDLAMDIYHNMAKAKMNGSFGGFFFKDIDHKTCMNDEFI